MGSGCTWRELIYSYVGDPKLFNCGTATSNEYPGDDKDNVPQLKSQFGMNAFASGKADGAFVNPSSCCFFADAGDTAEGGIVLSDTAPAKSGATAAFVLKDSTIKFADNFVSGIKSSNGVHARHGERDNVAFADGHVEAMRVTAIPTYTETSYDSTFWNPSKQ